MKKRFVIFFFLFSTLSTLQAQDTLPIKKNQIYAEGLGNNFADPNSNADAAFASINYSRKVIFENNCYMFSIGIGSLYSQGFDKKKNMFYTIHILEFPAGVLWRKKYKRNGFWVGAFFTPTFGRINYSNTSGSNNDSYTHKISFQLTPNISYQFQSKSENFFCRLSFSPKILASNFSKQYGDHQPLVLLWGGISIGGAW